jgi:hypothetical protein
METIIKVCLPIILAAACPLVAAMPRSNENSKNVGPDEGLRRVAERVLYSLEYAGHGIYRGHNAMQELSFDFDGREVHLSHPKGAVNFHFTGYGYGERLQKPAAATLSASGNRVEYKRRDLTEWYVNSSEGLEQGFTLSERPGTRDRGRDPLVIAMGVTGGLTPFYSMKEESVVLKSTQDAVLRYGGLKAWDARGRVLSSRLEVRGHEIRLIVDDQNAQYPVIVDPSWTAQQKLTAPAGSASNIAFGYSVALSGNYAVIGAYRTDVSPHLLQGAAYVFVRSGDVWTEQQELIASDGATNRCFGWSVALSGNTAVIGAPGQGGLGFAYVFVRAGSRWTQKQRLTPSDPAAGDRFGTSVSVSGDTALVGADRKTIGSHTWEGAAYVFVRSGGVWAQQQELTENGANQDFFGNAVSISGNTALIGAPGKSQFSHDQGSAYVFVRSGDVWTHQQQLIAVDGAAQDWFGGSLSLSGDTALIGAVGWHDGQGAAYVFVRSSDVWTLQQELTAAGGAASDDFGTVALSGDTAVIGAPSKRVGPNLGEGAAYVFMRSGGVWTEHQELTASDGAANESFGVAVSVNGTTTLIGNLPSNGKGAAYVFVQ